MICRSYSYLNSTWTINVFLSQKKSGRLCSTRTLIAPAPGPDGLSGAFFKAAWEVIKKDIVAMFHAIWELDCRSSNLLNEAQMVLLKKNELPSGLKDYRPISLIHSLGKLFSN